MREWLQPQALLRQSDRFFLDLRSPAVQEVIWDPAVEARMHKIFEFFVTSYKSVKPRSTTVGHHDFTMSLNHVIGPFPAPPPPPPVLLIPCSVAARAERG